MPKLQTRKSTECWTDWGIRYLWIPEMLTFITFVFALWQAKRAAVRPEILGTVGAAVIGPATYAVYNRWREERDVSYRESKQTAENADISLKLCAKDIEHGNFFNAEKKLLQAKNIFEQIFGGRNDADILRQYVELCWKLAYVLYMQNKFVEALQILDEFVLENNGNYRDGLNLKALVLFKVAREKDALPVLELSLKMDPHQNTFYMLYCLLKNDYQKVTQHNPLADQKAKEPLVSDSFLQSHELMQVLGLAHFAMKNYDEAVVMFYSAALYLKPAIISSIDKAYYLIKACEAAFLELNKISTQQNNVGRPTSAPASSPALVSAASSSDIKQADIDNKKFQVTLLDKDTRQIDKDFITKNINNAKELIAHYERFFPDNVRLQIVQQLIHQLDQKLTQPSQQTVVRLA